MLRRRTEPAQLRASRSEDKREEQEAWGNVVGEDNPYLQMMRGE